MALAMKHLIFFAIAILVVSQATEAKKLKQTQVEFYMHDTRSPFPACKGEDFNQALEVECNVSQNRFQTRCESNMGKIEKMCTIYIRKGSNPIAAMFGSIYMVDNPLTVTPALNSTVMGRAQGIYGMSSQHDELSLLMTLTYNFITSPYNGSSFSVVGRNPIANEVREMPVIGGTGMFRLARGYCLAKTYSTNQMDAIIGYNVTLLHY
ncbi:dirigent protein 19-like [Camellia sinensis]|uniref:dirigent protein 19-like n=1 Tax=Camellia sinensis TaxID=4442 RepID=UPI0010360305|nr:dirigent protein 19-like [Camellia sinensis]